MLSSLFLILASGTHIHVGTDVPTIAAAMKAAQPGDTIHLEPKRYFETADFSLKHGEEGKPITLDGHGAILDGSEPIQAETWEAVDQDLYRKVKLMPRMDKAILSRYLAKGPPAPPPCQ
jgi:hypothetical protein